MMKVSKPSTPNLRSPWVAAMLGAAAVAVIAVPAWARSDDGLEDELGRAQNPVPIPGVAHAATVHAGVPPGAEGRPESIAPLPGSPLSAEEMEEHREAVEAFTLCMQEHGQTGGDPGEDSFEIVIPIGDHEAMEEFNAAREECGGPPMPPPPIPEP